MSLEFERDVTEESPRTKNESLFVEVETLRKRQKESLFIPEIEGFSVAGFNIPAENVSGDGFGVISDSGKTKFYIFDVTSHGLSTSIDWGMAHAMFNFASRSGLSPKEAIYEVEYHLDKMTGHHIVPVTAIFGEIDKEGNMSYVHAGHTRPLFYSAQVGRVLPDNDVVIKEGMGNGRALNTGTEEPVDINNSEHNYYSH